MNRRTALQSLLYIGGLAAFEGTGRFFSKRPRQLHLLLIGLGLLSLFAAVASAEKKPDLLIGYTEGRNDLKGGQFVNWVTHRACVVGADGNGRKILAEELTKKEYSWTQFAGWSPDGKTAIIGSHWESAENAAWERAHKTFRMTEGWLSDTCLLDLVSGKITNVTAVDRVSGTVRVFPGSLGRRH